MTILRQPQDLATLLIALHTIILYTDICKGEVSFIIITVFLICIFLEDICLAICGMTGTRTITRQKLNVFITNSIFFFSNSYRAT